jgi:diguanylate cyclase (GGDEF)-like protein/PAS domain S-box-containing protein
MLFAVGSFPRFALLCASVPVMVGDAAEGRHNPPRLPPLWRLPIFALCLGLVSYTVNQLNMGSWNAGGNTILWPSNALLLGALLCNPKPRWRSYIAVAFAIDLWLNLFVDRAPLFSAALMSVFNMIEGAGPAFLLYPIMAPRPDLTQRRQCTAFLLYGVLLAPAITALLGSCVGNGSGRYAFSAPSLRGFFFWFSGDALGMATVTPLYLAWDRREYSFSRKWREAAGLFALLTAVTFAVFWQSRYPLLFLLIPVLLLLGARLGLAGSALGLMLVCGIGGVLSTLGRGPASLMKSAGMWERDLVLQLFIVITMLVLYAIEVLTAESRRTDADLRASERRFRLLAEASSDVIVLTDLDDTRRYVSPAALEVLGWSPEEVMGRNMLAVAHPEDIAAIEQILKECREGAAPRSLEYRCRRADGSYVWVEFSPRLYRDPDSGKAAGFVSVTRNISLRKVAEEEKQRAFKTVERMAESDALTEIANRRHFDAVIEQEWLRAYREQSCLSLLLLDIDRFKPYNDQLGHLAGDECLRRVVAAISPLVCRAADLLARYGGEEFVVVLPNTDLRGATQMAEKIRGTVETCRLVHPANPPYAQITISLGCAAIVPRKETTHLDLLRAADEALYRAKSSGRNCVCLADQPLSPGPVAVKG